MPDTWQLTKNIPSSTQRNHHFRGTKTRNHVLRIPPLTPRTIEEIHVAMTTQEAALAVLGMFPFTSLLETDANPSRAFL